jgi:hypothetical protein
MGPGVFGHRLDYDDANQGGREYGTIGGSSFLLVVNRPLPGFTKVGAGLGRAGGP